MLMLSFHIISFDLTDDTSSWLDLNASMLEEISLTP
jgi:hypothetical protein